jgi:hypothetical protein
MGIRGSWDWAAAKEATTRKNPATVEGLIVGFGECVSIIDSCPIEASDGGFTRHSGKVVEEFV